MEVKIATEDGGTVITIIGRVDTITAPKLEQEIAGTLVPGAHVTLDCKGMDYISSSGLRVVLGAFKKVSAGGGSLVLREVSPEVKEVLDMTGFSRFLGMA